MYLAPKLPGFPPKTRNKKGNISLFCFFRSPGVPVALEHVWQLREQRDDELPALAKVHQEVGRGREEHVWKKRQEFSTFGEFIQATLAYSP